MSNLAPYNVTLASTSPFFIYSPHRDGDALSTWNSSYTDSPIWPPIANQDEPKGIPYRRTLSPAADIEFEYLGSDIYLCLTGDDTSYTLTIDGQPVANVNGGPSAACSDYPPGTLVLYSSGIQMGSHTAHLHIVASSAHEFRFFGAIVTMGVTSGSSHVPAKEVDDLDEGWTMVPGRGDNDPYWQHGSDLASSNLIDNGHSWTCLYDSVYTRSASYNFTGAGGVLLRGTIGMGIEVFSIDFDGKHVPMDATSVWPDTSSVVMFMRGGLDPNKTYNIKLSNYNENYKTCDQLYYLPSSQHQLGCCVYLDGLVLLGDGGGSLPAPPRPDPPPTPPSPAPRRKPRADVRLGVIVGACISVVAAMAIIAGLLLYFKWRKRNHGREPAINPHAILATDSQMPAFRHPPRFSGDRYPSRSRDQKLSDFSIPTNPAKSISVADRNVPSLHISEAQASSTSLHQRQMPPQVMEEVLALIAERMDEEGPPRRQDLTHPGAEPATLPACRW